MISRVAPEGAEGLDGAGPEDVLVVERRDGGADERADPEDPLQPETGKTVSHNSHNKKKKIMIRPCPIEVVCSSRMYLSSYMVVPRLLVVEDDGRSDASGRVDAGAGDRDRRQVDHEHGEADWQRRQDLVTSTHT